MKIAIVDSDPVALAAVGGLLSASGYVCTLFATSRELMRSARRDSHDLIIIDWNLPDLAGVIVLEWVRNQFGVRPPVLLLTACGDDADIVAGLRAGADDFVAKPFDPAVLVARVEALMRRSLAGADRAAELYGPFEFDISSKTVRMNGAAVHLTPKEFSLALLLFRNLNQAVSRSYILSTVWGIDPTLSTRTLDIHISKIRAKLNLRQETGYRLTPVYGFGYRLEEIGR